MLRGVETKRESGVTTGLQRVFGVDPGTVALGYGVIESQGETHRAVGYGVLRASRTAALEDRLLKLYQQLLETLDQWQPTALAVEEPFVGGNPQTSLSVGRAQAIVLLAARQRGISVTRYAPAEVKGTVTDYGRGSKEQVNLVVRRMLGIAEPVPTDAADALAVALCHLWSRSRLAGLQELRR